MFDEGSGQGGSGSGQGAKAGRPTRRQYAADQQRREAWLDTLGVTEPEDRKLFSRLLTSGIDMTSVLSEADPDEQVALAMELVEKNKRKFDRMEHAYVPERTAVRDTMRIGSKAMAAIVEDRNYVRRALLLVARIRAEHEAKIARLTLLENELLVHFAGLTERRNAAFQALDLGPAVTARVLEFNELLRSQTDREDAPSVDNFLAWCTSRKGKKKDADEVLEALRETLVTAEGMASNTDELRDNRCDHSTSDEPPFNMEETDYKGPMNPSETADLDDTSPGVDAGNSNPKAAYTSEQADCLAAPAHGHLLSPDMRPKSAQAESDDVSEQDRTCRVKPIMWLDFDQRATGYDVITYFQPSDQLPPYDEAFMPPVSTMVELGTYAQIDNFDPAILALWDTPAIGLNHDGASLMLDRKLALAVARKAIQRALTEAAKAGRVIDLTDDHISMMARFWTFAIVGRNRPELIMSEWPANFFRGVRGHSPFMEGRTHFWVRDMISTRI